MKIEILIDDKERKPTVLVDGKEIVGLRELNLSWLTNSKYSFNVKLLDKNNNKEIKYGFAKL